ncbi:dihydroorotate dehydrogenase [Orbilia ellipsospora]|uniref:Dihydroorotate dehydrogenase (fumarate) n=1 Tax=Orbilia ellipsospora TaxID=2528407 RepID=A0AAV9WY00_9PEZI
MAPQINISPPLLNTSSPWATTQSDLSNLYALPSTGAVSTRTSFLTTGFPDDPSIHQHAFISPSSSLNTYGYSPHPLPYYLTSIKSILAASDQPQRKPFIISITGSDEEVVSCISLISKWTSENSIIAYAEINLSCPNIPDKPPPAYSSPALCKYIASLKNLQATSEVDIVPIGVKTPPYTYQLQFDELISAVEQYPGVISFITATNTLGNSLFLTNDVDDGLKPVINSAAGTGVGGLAGESIHPLSLGNVFTIRRMLDASANGDVKDIVIIGAGGVRDSEGYKRMRKAGAVAVGVGTAFGRDGIEVFDRILKSD